MKIISTIAHHYNIYTRDKKNPKASREKKGSLASRIVQDTQEQYIKVRDKGAMTSNFLKKYCVAEALNVRMAKKLCLQRQTKIKSFSFSSFILYFLFFSFFPLLLLIIIIFFLSSGSFQSTISLKGK